MISQIVIYLVAFLLISIAAYKISLEAQKLGFPFITSVLLIGILAGPFVLQMFPSDGVHQLGFINDIALSFIAFAAGSEIFMKEIRSRVSHILWITIFQSVVIFLLGTVSVYFIFEHIPFTQVLPRNTKVAIAILMGVLFIVGSPASVIAIINEMRAKGPFTQTALSVTVIIDVLQIFLFTTFLAIGKFLINGDTINSGIILVLVLEIIASVVFGFLLSKIFSYLLSLSIKRIVKSILILVLGYYTYALANYMEQHFPVIFGVHFQIEPLIVCITTGFFITNYSKFRLEFSGIIESIGPYVFLAFFTLVGISISFDLLLKVWEIALILFIIRLLGIIIGTFIGGKIAGDSMRFNLLGWMPYVTQAGVTIGLATMVVHSFPIWGEQFFTIIIAMIIISQLVGPPLFKLAIHLVKEGRTKAESQDGDDMRDVIIFGYENQSIALAKQLIAQGWKVKIATKLKPEDVKEIPEVEFVYSLVLSKEALLAMECAKANTIVALLSDKDNLTICEIAFENMGTKNMVVRLQDRKWFNQFHALGAKIIDPNTAMVSLLDHFVRSPQAASLLLGLEENQDTIDIEITDKNIHGMALRNLRFPVDVTILSVYRKGSALVCHGFTRLRVGDIVTVVGSIESLEKVRLKLTN